MREPVEREIRSHLYRVTPLPAGKALRLLARLAKILGPGLGSALGKASSLAALARDLGPILGSITDRLEPDEVEVIARELAASSHVKLAKGWVKLGDVFDVHFSEDLVALLHWLAFSLEVQLAPLLDEAKVLAGAPAGSDATEK